MHYLIFYNSTQSQLDGSWIYYCIVTYIEFFGICLSYPILTYIVFLMLTTRPFHVNLKTLWLFLASEYYTQLTVRSVQIFLIFYSLENSQLFYYTSFIRCACYFVVSLIIPAFVTERMCASYFLSDYEGKNRFQIAFAIIATMCLIGVVLSQQYHHVESTLFLHVAMLLVNMLAWAVNSTLERFNYRKLRESANLRKGRREYSLAERFQISENIRTCLTLKAVMNTVAVFNFISTATAALDNFDLSPAWLNLGSTVFNVCVLTYGSMAQVTVFAYIPIWRSETKRYLTKLRMLNPVSPQLALDPSKPLALVRKETETYFEQLDKQWQ